ncbi:MAG: VOC family protein [Streptococcaceae bacterium]|nr:VOC family protein [Streptococcaceae bacterium]
MVKIEHIGLWCRDLEAMRAFYETYFEAKSNELYHNQTTGFRSYFLTFASGARLELMSRADISENTPNVYGFAHLALQLEGGKVAVDSMVEKMTADGFSLLNGPRTTGDGYYEAVIADLEGNLLELTA